MSARPCRCLGAAHHAHAGASSSYGTSSTSMALRTGADDFSCLSWLLFRVFVLFAYDENHSHNL